MKKRLSKNTIILLKQTIKSKKKENVMNGEEAEIKKVYNNEMREVKREKQL